MKRRKEKSESIGVPETSIESDGEEKGVALKVIKGKFEDGGREKTDAASASASASSSSSSVSF